ncbi:phage holin family protein [Blastococcus goldschmidtiae]|uniref:Phage holin family protein n=1 Tax=Blastococcus goldschmidtiae TaxID=3075546 RepID=A0ABU2KD82_9ACTN|nr:phage holin family protein [Blastococcus sp. DSM 46792]MDT0278127.1 phage holin family protein [Blastococcus sp. DSM 46792]
MSTPYSGATPAGGQAGYAPPADPAAQQNYASDYTENTAHSGAMGTPMTAAGNPDIEGISVGTLIGEVTKDLSTLMRQELELAKVEMKAEAKKAGQGAGMFGAAGFAGYMVALFLSLALMWALASAIPTGWSALIVAILWGIVGAVAFVMGRKKFQQVNPKPERTVDTLSEVPGALKPN